MSALNCFVAPDAVHVFTDAGHYDRGSVDVCGIGNKAAILPEYNAVVAAVGLAFIPNLFASSLADIRLSDFDELAAQLPDLVRRCMSRFTAAGGPPHWDRFDLVLAGWQDGPSAFHLRADGIDFQISEVTRFRSPNHPDFDSFAFNPATPAESGLNLMRLQRSRKFAVPTATPKPRDSLRNMLASEADRTDGYRVVHGFCQHARVSVDGVTVRVIERWPDKVG